MRLPLGGECGGFHHCPRNRCRVRASAQVDVASTKAFLGQVSVLTLIAAWMGRRRHLAPEALQEVLAELEQMPLDRSVLTQRKTRIREIASAVVDGELVVPGTRSPLARWRWRAP